MNCKRQESHANLEGFVDSDNANDPDTRRSITGYVSKLARDPYSGSGRQQVTVVLSTMEAEYMGACAATQDAMWLKLLLQDLGLGGDKAKVDELRDYRGTNHTS